MDRAISSAIQLIGGAIRKRRVIQFRYMLRMRQAEPHCLGYDEAGALILQAWQITGPEPGWRCFEMAKLSELSPTERHFEQARQDYGQGNPALIRVVARL